MALKLIFSVGALFFLTLFINFKEVSMKNVEADFKYFPLNIEDMFSIHAVKLIKRNQNIELVFSTKHEMNPRKIYSIPIVTGGNPQLLVQLPPFPLLHQEWDIKVNSDNSYSVIFTDGINFNSLLTQNWKSDDNILISENNISVTKKYLYRNFFHPRFVKRHKDTAMPISAIFREDDEKNCCVVFSKMQDSDYGKYKKLPECDDSVVIKYKESFLFFYKSHLSGPSRGEMDISPGTLCFVELDKNFNVVGSKIQPFRDLKIYEFDVDIIMDKIVIFVTTEVGMILTVIKPLVESFEVVSFHAEHYEAILTQPSVLAADSRIYLAVVESLGTDNAQILTGYSSIDMLR